MHPESFYSSLRGYLRVSATVTHKAGTSINVGEKFTLRVSGTNMASIPQIVFLNPRVFVTRTQYARPVEDGTVNMALTDTVLRPGESSSVDITMLAVSEIPDWWEDLFSREKVAGLTIYASLDQDRFFRVWNSSVVHH
jgi:hypothetical protein